MFVIYKKDTRMTSTNIAAVSFLLTHIPFSIKCMCCNFEHSKSKSTIETLEKCLKYVQS